MCSDYSPPRPPMRMLNIPPPHTRLSDWRARIQELKEENRLLQRAIDMYGKGGHFATRQHDRNVGKIDIYRGKIDALEKEMREAAGSTEFGSGKR